MSKHFVLRRVQCEECQHLQRLEEDGKVCPNGVCRLTNKVEPAQHKGGVWCMDFRDFKGREQRKPRKKKGGKK